MTITSSGASARTPAGKTLSPELTEQHRSDLTTNSDHNGMRYEAVRPDTWAGRSPGERQHRVGEALSWAARLLSASPTGESALSVAGRAWLILCRGAVQSACTASPHSGQRNGLRLALDRK